MRYILCGDEVGNAQDLEKSELAKAAAQNHRCRMISQTKVQKLGDELGVVLSNEVLQAMGVKEGSTLHITQAPGSAMLLTPDQPGFAEKMKIAEQCMKRYSNALRELAQ